jgi:PKD repeat protein
MLGICLNLPVMRLAKRVPPKVEAEFLGAPATGQWPHQVDFTDLSSGQPDTWSWAFGDGGTSNQKNPSHTYTVAGLYTVTLNVSGALGMSAKTKVGYVLVVDPPVPATPPVANFIGTPRLGTAPLEVTFTDATSNVPEEWDWAFGDGAFSDQQNPVHVFTEPGDYAVALVAANADGSDAEVKPGYITVLAPAVQPNALLDEDAQPILDETDLPTLGET